jgi:hypothetical protein
MGAHGIFSGAVDKWETAGGGGGPTHAARRNWRAMETLHLQSARESLHIRSCGQQLSLLATELGWRPLATDWLRQAARFWTKTMLRPDGDLLKEAMRESWELAAGGVQQCWVAQLSVCLSNTGHTLEWGQEVAGIAQLMETAVAGWLASEMSTPELPEGTDQLSVVRSVPDAWSHRYKMLTYRRWMADDSGSASMLLTGLNCSTQITTLARFRMGLHELQIEAGRYAGQAEPRSQRLCRLCGTREDEAHVIFECPAYIEARTQFNTLFLNVPKDDKGLDAQMRAFMNPSPGLFYPGFWRDLANFLVS